MPPKRKVKISAAAAARLQQMSEDPEGTIQNAVDAAESVVAGSTLGVATVEQLGATGIPMQSTADAAPSNVAHSSTALDLSGQAPTDGVPTQGQSSGEIPEQQTADVHQAEPATTDDSEEVDESSELAAQEPGEQPVNDDSASEDVEPGGPKPAEDEEEAPATTEIRDVGEPDEADPAEDESDEKPSSGGRQVASAAPRGRPRRGRASTSRRLQDAADIAPVHALVHKSFLDVKTRGPLWQQITVRPPKDLAKSLKDRCLDDTDTAGIRLAVGHYWDALLLMLPKEPEKLKTLVEQFIRLHAGAMTAGKPITVNVSPEAAEMAVSSTKDLERLGLGRKALYAHGAALHVLLARLDAAGPMPPPVPAQIDESEFLDLGF